MLQTSSTQSHTKMENLKAKTESEKFKQITGNGGTNKRKLVS